MRHMSLLATLAPLVYIQVSPERVTLRNVKGGQSVSEPPHLAINRQLKAPILAVGAEAATRAGPGVEVVNPFGHPARWCPTSCWGSSCSRR